MTAAVARYWAFISYSHQDEAWARWLHRALETYRVPRRLVGRTTDAGTLPRRLFPIFRDRDELPSSHELGAVINRALQDSRNLIVICSPRSATSRWVNEEIRAFRALGRSGRIFCLIVDGEPHASARPDIAFSECFAPALRGDDTFEPIAADARDRKDGKANAKLKLLAGLLGVGLDELKQREKQRRFWQRLQVAAGALAIGAALGGSWQWFLAQRDAREREIRIEKLVESGRLELVDHREARAAAYLAEALALGRDTVPLRFMLGQAMRAVDAQTGVRVRHGGGHVRSALFSPDGSRFVLILENTGGDVVGKVYDAGSGAELAVLEGVSPFPRIVRFLPDGEHLLVSGFRASWSTTHAEEDATTGIWKIGQPAPVLALAGGSGRIGTPLEPAGRYLLDAPTAGGMERRSLGDPQARTIVAPDRRFTALSYSPDGRIVASADAAGAIDLWSAEPLKPLARLSGFEGQSVVGVQFTPDGRRLLAFSSFGDIRVWDVERRAQVLAFAADAAWIGGLSFSADGRRFLTVGGEGYKVWSAARGVLLFSLPIADAWFATAALSPDGNFLYTADASAPASEIWSVRSRQRVHSLDAHTGAVTAAALDSTGHRLLVASVDGTAEIWDTAINPVLGMELMGEVPYSVRFDGARGLLVAGGSPQRGRAFLMEPSTGAVTREFAGHGAYIRAASIGAGDRLLTAGADGASILWDLRDGRQTATLDQGPDWLNLADFSPDGARAVTAPYSARAQAHAAGVLWDAATGARLADLVHDRPVYAFAFSPDSRRLATASEDGTVKLWDGRTGALAHVLKGHTGPVLSVTFDADGHRVVSSGQDNSVRVWDAASGAPLATLDDPGVGWGLQSVFAPDGRSVAIGTRVGNILIWRPGEHSFRALSGHSLDVVALRFLHGGSILLSRSADGTVRAWDVAAGQQLATVAAPGGFIHSMDVSGDLARLAVASSTYYAGIWDIALEQRDAATLAADIGCRSSWALAAGQLVPRQPTPCAPRASPAGAGTLP